MLLVTRVCENKETHMKLYADRRIARWFAEGWQGGVLPRIFPSQLLKILHVLPYGILEENPQPPVVRVQKHAMRVIGLFNLFFRFRPFL